MKKIFSASVMLSLAILTVFISCNEHGAPANTRTGSTESVTQFNERTLTDLRVTEKKITYVTADRGADTTCTRKGNIYLNYKIVFKTNQTYDSVEVMKWDCGDNQEGQKNLKICEQLQTMDAWNVSAHYKELPNKKPELLAITIRSIDGTTKPVVVWDKDKKM